ncbi:MAG: hypothetical protein R3C56_20070 [Pirellulaceae bacterium]
MAQADRQKNRGPSFAIASIPVRSTGAKFPCGEQIQIASKAGYDAIELGCDVTQFVEQGGKVAELAKEIADLGLGLDSHRLRQLARRRRAEAQTRIRAMSPRYGNRARAWGAIASRHLQSVQQGSRRSIWM